MLSKIETLGDIERRYIVDIIRDHLPKRSRSRAKALPIDNMIEVKLDNLPLQVLWQLHRYVEEATSIALSSSISSSTESTTPLAATTTQQQHDDDDDDDDNDGNDDDDDNDDNDEDEDGDDAEDELLDIISNII
jgi:cobalamin biosynthesis protein CobT